MANHRNYTLFKMGEEVEITWTDWKGNKLGKVAQTTLARKDCLVTVSVDGENVDFEARNLKRRSS